MTTPQGQRGPSPAGDPRDPRSDATPFWGAPHRERTTILLARHGQTELSVERRFAGRDDTALTKEGVGQAGLLARRLAGTGADVIVTSPLLRARKTAEAIAEATGVPMLVDEDLAEADFGLWQGLTFAEAASAWPGELAAWLSSPDVAPPGGESFAKVALRVLASLDRLIEAHRHGKLVVVSHVTPIKTLVCRALLAPPQAMFRISLDVASLTRMDCFDDGSAVVRSLNDTGHLRQRQRRLGGRGGDSGDSGDSNL